MMALRTAVGRRWMKAVPEHRAAFFLDAVECCPATAMQIISSLAAWVKIRDRIQPDEPTHEKGKTS
jgi:hypothetical protein